MDLLASEMKEGSRGILRRLQLDEETKRRLFFLGIREGGTLCFLRRAPLKDPLLFMAEGNWIMVRKELADCLEVEILP